MATPWKLEEEEGPSDAQIMLQRDVATLSIARQLDTLGKQKVKPEYKTKAYLVLVNSDKEDWGIVEDTLNDLLWQPGKGEIVGTWSKPRYDNLIHMSLCTSLSALQDRSIQTFARYAEERRQRGLGAKKPATKARRTGEPVQEPAPDISLNEKLKFNSLRARLGKTK